MLHVHSTVTSIKTMSKKCAVGGLCFFGISYVKGYLWAGKLGWESSENPEFSANLIFLKRVELVYNNSNFYTLGDTLLIPRSFTGKCQRKLCHVSLVYFLEVC